MTDGATAVIVAATVLGALLPVAVYRFSVPFDEPLRAACEHCGRSLPWLRLPSRCPVCRRSWGPPWWATAAVAGVASAGLAWALGPVAVLPAFGALAVVGTGLGAIDVACQRLPSVIVWPAAGASVIVLGASAAAGDGWDSWVRAMLAAIVFGLVLWLLHLLPGGNLGFGDVQLAVLLGLFLGYLGWRELAWGILLPWLINAPVLLVLLLIHRVGRRSRIPFGPAMVAGAWAAVLLVAALPA